MRTLAALLSAAVVCAGFCFPSVARADSMDPAIERLTLPFEKDAGTGITADQLVSGSSCTGAGGRFLGNPALKAGGVAPFVLQCSPDNIAFARLINQYGAAVAPTAMHSARTTGFGGFHLSFEGAFTGIDNDASYWKKGTRGPQDASDKKFSVVNSDPASTLQVYSIKVRKGFPFGLEVSAQVGTMSQTNIVTGGADVRISVLEGFRKGAFGILPDIAVGGGVRTTTGTPQFNLTVASFDLQASKNLPIAESSILIPYIGFQQLLIFGDSGLVDTTPQDDPLGYCNYSGANLPGNQDKAKVTNPSDPNSRFYDGQPNCSGNGVSAKGSPLDFNNTFVFQKTRLARQRLIAGLHYRYEYVYLGGQFMTDIGKPEDAGLTVGSLFGFEKDNKAKLAGEKSQNAFVIELGAFF